MKNEKKNIQNVDDYLATLTPDQQRHLEKIRELVLSASPELEEGLNYSTPAYRTNGKLVVGIAAAKRHTGFYVMSEAVMNQFKDRLMEYELAKTSFSIPLDKVPSAELVKQIVLARTTENSNGKSKSTSK
ncbi:iron chaperone [Pedobacter heparinus]|uniref:YdhG-like domain-containing protein n=1 Tax=Pedobacter heparinus (strain ATCC 13125 / DSM 2366 / CIP 104194 / JCM 7457 / NBRC 12017 / NCIMB 9290 / NRRL B-14731 / HIM 762-3) TaxID=485917 RepID=C6XVD2_PEDHD|nr:DUF1801 domain-containing protein [Pedobacter heparinus]ACU03998.1 Domain of unknown function DUF1801 [Pedobacter heparinus DSM 2366]